MQKTWTLLKKKKKERGGLLNCYNFVYVGRDTANTATSQLNKIVRGLIMKTSSKIDQIAQRRIKQAINQGVREIEWVSPKLIKGAIKEFCKTPF